MSGTQVCLENGDVRSPLTPWPLHRNEHELDQERLSHLLPLLDTKYGGTQPDPEVLCMLRLTQAQEGPSKMPDKGPGVGGSPQKGQGIGGCEDVGGVRWSLRVCRESTWLENSTYHSCLGPVVWGLVFKDLLNYVLINLSS